MDTIYQHAPILEWDADSSDDAKKYFFGNKKKPFHQFDEVKKLGIHKALIFFPRAFNSLKEIVKKCKKIYDFKAASSISPIYLYDKKFIIALCPLGGPSAANLMEELSFVGIDTFIACGSCGCLLKEFPDVKYFLPTDAIRDEGLSYHYLPPNRTVDTNAELNQIIRTTLIEENKTFIEGRIWTTDAMYRETPNRIQRRMKEGALGVDMECASLAACAKFNKLKFSALFYFTDLIHATTWQWRMYDKVKLRTNLIYMCEKVLDKIK